VRYESSEPSLAGAFPAMVRLVRHRGAGGDGFRVCYGGGGGDGFRVCCRDGGGDGSLVASLNSCLSASRAASASGHVSPSCFQLSAKAPVSSLGFCGVGDGGLTGIFFLSGVTGTNLAIAGCPVRGYVPGMAPLSGVRGVEVCTDAEVCADANIEVYAGGVIGVCATGSSGAFWGAGQELCECKSLALLSNLMQSWFVEVFWGRGLVRKGCFKTLSSTIRKEGDFGPIVIVQYSSVSTELSMVGRAFFISLPQVV